MNRESDIRYIGLYLLFEKRKQEFVDWMAKRWTAGHDWTKDTVYNALAKKFEDNYIKPIEKLEKEFDNESRV